MNEKSFRHVSLLIVALFCASSICIAGKKRSQSNAQPGSSSDVHSAQTRTDGTSRHAPADSEKQAASESKAIVRAFLDPATGQIEVTDAGRPVLRYNYRTVALPDGFLEKVAQRSRKYARARSDYIHPLYGPDGEVLTKDFSPDHPHHRGIYWAWPEVSYGEALGDLHALQHVFARPTGNIQLQSGSDFAQIDAENLWKWEDQTPIVRELTTIRVYRLTEQGRHIDLKFQFTALVEGVRLARRGRTHYGGLNIRLSPVKNLKLIHYADPAGTEPRRAWSDSVGIRAGGTKPVGFAVFEKTTNPHYPGDWITYEYLPWFQPAFPAAGVRYALSIDKPLVLEYRLWIRRGGQATVEEYTAQWRAFNRSTKE